MLLTEALKEMPRDNVNIIKFVLNTDKQDRPWLTYANTVVPRRADVQCTI